MRILVAIFVLGVVASAIASDSDESVDRDDFFDSRGECWTNLYHGFSLLFETVIQDVRWSAIVSYFVEFYGLSNGNCKNL